MIVTRQFGGYRIRLIGHPIRYTYCYHGEASLGLFCYSVMKRSELFFSFLLVPVDYLMLLLAGSAAYFLRYGTFLADVRPVVFDITFTHYFQIVALVGLVWLPIFAFAGLYVIRRPRRLMDEFSKVILGCSTGLISIVFFIFFRHELFGSRFLVLFGWFAAIVFVFFGRVLVRMVQRRLYERGIGVIRVVVFGSDAEAGSFIRALKEDSRSGLRVVRHFRTCDDSSRGMLLNIARQFGADMVVHAGYDINRSERASLVRMCQDNHLDFSYASDTFEAQLHNVSASEIAGVPLVHIKRTPLDGWGRIAKRVVDVVLSFVLIILLVPLGLAISLFIATDTRGPIFISLSRVGEGGKAFRLYKFRSMVVGAHKMKNTLQAYNERGDGPLFKMKNDPRITRTGRFLRAWSMDELPNLFNVIKGDMSLIGPRPHEPEEVGRYQGSQRRLLGIKPGVTGLAQVSGRSDLTFEEEARLDLFYIENWSLVLDFGIFLRTPWVVITGKNAA